MCLFGFDVGEAVVGDGGNGWFFRKEWLLSRWFVSEGQRKWVWVGMGFWVSGFSGFGCSSSSYSDEGDVWGFSGFVGRASQVSEAVVNCTVMMMCPLVCRVTRVRV